MTDFESLLRLLARQGVEFIIVGGAAATVHGSSRLTQDLDLVYRRSPENCDVSPMRSGRTIRTCGELPPAFRFISMPKPFSAA